MAPSKAVKYLGVWLDNTLSISKHVTKLASSCYFFLYNLRRIRKYLSKSACETLINALVVSRLDYCNSLFTAILPNFSHNFNVSKTVQLDSSTTINVVFSIISSSTRSSLAAHQVSLHFQDPPYNF